MMNGYGLNNGTASNATPLTVDQAKQAAGKYIQSLNIQGFEIGEVMIFDNNAYVVVKESDTGLGAFELLVDPVSQIAYPEYGPNMMWNLKYGGLNHSGMMFGIGAAGRHGMMERFELPIYDPGGCLAGYDRNKRPGHQERPGLSRPISARNHRR